MDTDENRWRRERKEFMHPRYVRARFSQQMAEVEVRGSTPFGAFSRRYELSLIIRMFFSLGTTKNGRNPMAAGLQFFA